MTTPVGAFVYRNHSIEVDTEEFSNQIRKSILMPTTNKQTYKVAVPGGVIADVDDPTWVWQITGLQINVTDGFAKYLRDNAGTLIDVVFLPQSGVGKPQATFTCMAEHVPFGGEEGQFATIDIELGIQGTPVFGTSV